MAPLKTKGDMAELVVAADLVKRGFRVAFPFGEDSDFDLIFWRPPSSELERVQVKCARLRDGVVMIKSRSHSLTAGRVRTTKRYTKATIDWLAGYEQTTDRVYYLPAEELGTGMTEVRLRLVRARNNQQARIRLAENYLAPTIQATGL